MSFLLGLTCTTATLHTLAQYIAAERGDACLPDGTGTPPLPDILHPLTANKPRVKKTCAHVSEVLLVGALVLLACTKQLRNFCFRVNLAFILRSICMMVTSLPDASQCCTVTLLVDSRGKTGSCHDLMFSGHMTVTTLALLLAVQKHKALAPLVLPMLLTQTFAIPLSHNHYTVDVVVALVVASLLTVAPLPKL